MHAANHLDIHDLVIKDFGAGETSSEQGTLATKISFIIIRMIWVESMAKKGLQACWTLLDFTF